MCPIIDFSEVKELEALPAGEYSCIVSDVKRVDKQGKDSYYAVKFTVSEDDSEYNGRTLFRNLSTSAKSLWAIKRFLLTCGADEDVFDGDVDLDEAFAEIKGAEVICVAAVKLYGEPEREVNEVVNIKAA